MLIITREIETIGGSKVTQELMRHESTGRLMFRSYFETHGFNTISCETERDLLELLDKQFINEGKFLVYGDDILYPLSEDDRSLAYFGTITLA